MGPGEVMSMQNKVVVVTGGAKGIGLGCTLKFIAEKAIVVCADLDEKLMLALNRKWKNWPPKLKLSIKKLTH
jgi:NAD(P)-dependent dehydrogenase (short-subunit alcohol dehydrogenase family)